MARIQLRDCSIYLQDGLDGSAAVNEPSASILASPAQATTQEGSITDDEVQTIAAFVGPVTGTYQLQFNLAGPLAFTTDPIPANANAATVQAAVDAAATAASVPSYSNGDIAVTGGPLTSTPLTLTFSGTSVEETNHGQTTIDGSGLVSTALSSDTSLTIDSVVLNTDVTDRVPVGARFTVAGEVGSPVHTVTARTPSSGTTTSIDFVPALADGVLDNAVIIFLPQRVQVKIGDGDLSWTEAREMIYDLDRDRLDTVRQGADQPVEADLAFTFEYVTAQSGRPPTPVDILKRKGEAQEWVSTSDDLCEPYAVDIYVVHELPCGTDEDQDVLLKTFRWENLDYSIQDATIAVSGRCNITEVESTRFSS